MPDKRSFLLLPTTYGSLSKEICQLVDAYQSREIDEARLTEVVLAWKEKVPSLLFETSEQKAIAKGVARYIGKNRTKVINIILGL